MTKIDAFHYLSEQWHKVVCPATMPYREEVMRFGDLIFLHAHGRRHHTLDHLEGMLRRADQFESSDPAAVRFAIFYHSAVIGERSRMSLRPPNNDRHASDADLSVGLAREHMNLLQFSEERQNKVAGMIYAIWSQDGDTNDRDTALFLDNYLSVLGAAPEVYARYEFDLCFERADIPLAQYRQERMKFIDSMLSRPRIFRTDEYEAVYGAAARRNLTAERTKLSILFPALKSTTP